MILQNIPGEKRFINFIRTRAIKLKAMNMNRVESLKKNAVSPNHLTVTGNYTSPRSFGVHRLTATSDVGKRFRFGNHPVRMHELVRDYGGCEIEAIFLERSDAELMARLLNSK